MTDLLDADRLVAAADAGARIAYAENLLFSPYVREAVSRARHIAPYVHLEARSLQPRPTWGDFLTERWGGGVLFDLGVHPLAVVLAAAGDDRPVAVEARLEGDDQAGGDGAGAQRQQQRRAAAPPVGEQRDRRDGDGQRGHDREHHQRALGEVRAEDQLPVGEGGPGVHGRLRVRRMCSMCACSVL